MLVITAKQLEQLDATRLAEFHRVCARAVRARHAEDAEHLDDCALMAMIRTVDGRATREFRVEDEGSRFKIVLLALKHPGLAAAEVAPEVFDLMTWPDRPDERKLAMLETHLKSHKSAANLPAKE